jgi:hypothetical protein
MSTAEEKRETGWTFSFFTKTKKNRPSLRVLPIETVYKAFIKLVAENNAQSIQDTLSLKPKIEIYNLINFVLEDKELKSEVKNNYLLILLYCLAGKNKKIVKQDKVPVPNFNDLKLSDANLLLKLVIYDETLNKNKVFRNQCFLLWLRRLSIEYDSIAIKEGMTLIDFFKESDISELLTLVIADTSLRRNQPIRDQCLVQFLKKLTNQKLSITDPMVFAITVLTADIEKPEQEYTDTLCTVVLGLFLASFSEWMNEKDYDKARVMKKNLSVTLCALAKLKLTKNFSNSPRRDKDIFHQCLMAAGSMWKKVLDREDKQHFPTDLSELIIFQISYLADEHGEKKHLTRENLAQAKIVGDKICTQLQTKLPEKKYQITVKHLAELAGRFAEAISLLYSSVDYNDKRKHIKELLADSDTISGTAAIRRKKYFITCFISSIVLLGAGAGLFSRKGMEFLHTTPGVYATYLATIGPSSILSVASFIFVMLNRRKFFSNSITRAMYEFFDSAFNFSERKDCENAQKVLDYQGTPSSSPVKVGVYESEECSYSPG